MHITARQVKAARMLLDWNQEDLSTKAGISKNSVINFEGDKGTPQRQTYQKMIRTLEAAGIEFTEGSGVKLRTGIVTYEGQEGFVAFMTDVLKTAQNEQSDICVSNVDENNWDNNLPPEFAEHYCSTMSQLPHLKSRVLVKRGDTFLRADSFVEYRSVPDNMFSEDSSFYAYGDKLALITFHNDSVQIVILHNQQFASSFRVMFNAIWDNHERLK